MTVLGRKTGGTAIRGAQVGVCSNRRREGATQASQEAFLQEVGLGYGLREGRIQSGREWLGDTRLDTPVEECARGQWAWPFGGRAAQGGMALAGR